MYIQKCASFPAHFHKTRIRVLLELPLPRKAKSELGQNFDKKSHVILAKAHVSLNGERMFS